jgi:hypothetical protein
MDPEEPTYREAVCIGWALFWRVVGCFMLLIFATNGLLLFLLPELTRSGPPLWVALLPFFLVTVLCTFLVMPYVIRYLFRTPFRGFHVRFVRGS